MRWKNCPRHRTDDVQRFLSERFASKSRRVLLIAGAGFDPRARHIPLLLSDLLGDRLRVLLIKEERPTASADLIARADTNQAILAKSLMEKILLKKNNKPRTH